MTMAHDDETTQKMRTMADRFWENCKFGDIQPARKYANASVTTYPEFDSEVTIGSAGGKAKGRGGTYTDFHGSEVAFWPDAEKIVAGAMQGGNPDVILESTPNGAQGYFYELCTGAMRGDNGWTLHFYPWWWDDAYRLDGADFEPTDEESALMLRHSLDLSQIRWRRKKQQELKTLFAQEYPEDPIGCFLTSGNSYFGDISYCFTAPINPPKKTDHKYCMGLDFGQTNDPSVAFVLDENTGEIVDKVRLIKLEWAEQRKRIKELYTKWNCRILLAEKNSIGSVNIEALRADGLKVVGFDTTNASKADIMSDLYEALHDGSLKLQDWSILRHELNTFVSAQTPSGLWRLAAEGAGHDDTVIALALTWRAKKHRAELPNNNSGQQVSKWRNSDDNFSARKY
jgi:phage FluMu gp28-like protein